MENRWPSNEQIDRQVRDKVAVRYDRGPCDVEPSAGLDRLHDQLVEAARAYDAGPQNQREAVCDGIMAVNEYLKGQGFGSAARAPLNRVLRAIVDLCKQNHPDPLFCEKPQKTKPRRNLESAFRQGQLAAFADAWLRSCAVDEGDEATKLERAARRLSGPHFGNVDGATLSSARSYQRQAGQHDLVYRSYEQMAAVLEADEIIAGPGASGLRIAIEMQIKAMNEKAKMLQP